MHAKDRLRWLDDRMMQLHWIDSAVKLGRMEGELREMTVRLGEPYVYPRTPEYRLQRHYEREFNRIVRSTP